MVIHEDRCIVKYSNYPTTGTTVTNEGIGGVTYNGTANDNNYSSLPSGATCFAFNNTTDAVVIPSGGVKTNSPFTIELVFYLNSISPTNGCIPLVGAGWNFYFQIGPDGSGIIFKQGPPADWTKYILGSFSAGIFTSNKWYHVQITWDTSVFTSIPSMKVNNIDITTYKGTVGTITQWVGDTAFNIGGVSTWPPTVKIALFRFHDRILTSEELTDNYYADNWRYTYVKPFQSVPEEEEEDASIPPVVSRLPKTSRPSALVDADCRIIIRNADLEDVGEITRFSQWVHTLKLNEISSWQLDMTTDDFRKYDIDENTGILFYRDNDLLIDGPIMPNGIKHTLSSGVETTTIIGGCDLAYLVGRICYPVVTGPLFDTKLESWRFGVQRSAVGINSAIKTGCETKEEYDIPLVLDNAESYLVGSTCNWLTEDGHLVTEWHDEKLKGSNNRDEQYLFNTAPIVMTGVDLSTNTITIDVPQGVSNGGTQPRELYAPPIPAGGRIYQTSGGIVNDPDYEGFDVRTGTADDVVKQLVWFNAGRGACADHFGTRAIPKLEIADPNQFGSTVTANSRGETLLTQVQNVCLSGGINFKITQKGMGQEEKTLVFDTFAGADLSVDGNLIFSIEGGNLKEYTYSYGPPTANYVWGCGPNTGPDKLMLPSGNQRSIDDYGRWESWISNVTASAGSTAENPDPPATIAANMVQANNIALAKSVINANLTLTIQETDQVRYPRDFSIGDKVGIMVGKSQKKQLNEIITTLVYSIPGQTGTASGSALMAVLTKQETRSMLQQRATSKLLQQMAMV
jgi:hypothetical protein